MYSDNCNCNCNSNTNIRINGSLSGVLSNPVLRGLSAYELAVAGGFEGTEEQFLESLKGDTIELKEENSILYWKYKKDTAWNLLIDLSSKLDISQGTDNVGKVMVVDENGLLIPKKVETLQFVNEDELDATLQEVFG